MSPKNMVIICFYIILVSIWTELLHVLQFRFKFSEELDEYKGLWSGGIGLALIGMKNFPWCVIFFRLLGFYTWLFRRQFSKTCLTEISQAIWEFHWFMAPVEFNSITLFFSECDVWYEK